MAIMFNADEIFEMAKQIERNGAVFYRKAAAKFPKARSMLLELADQEDEHLATFKKMQKALSPGEKEPTVYDPENEGLLYIQAMADTKVFDVKKDPVELLRDAGSLKDVLKIAIGLERNSVLFYLGIKAMVPSKSGAGKIDSIIKEEMRHIIALSEKRANI